MNKTYRVIFSKARGALMVVDELTSSVQKKGCVTVTATALTALLCSASIAAPIDPSSSEFAGQFALTKWTATQAPTRFSSEAFTMTGEQASTIAGSKNYMDVMEIMADAKGSFSDFDITMKAIEPTDGKTQDKQIIGIQQRGGNVFFDGNTFHLSVTSDFVGGGNNQLSAIYSQAPKDAKLEISAKETSIDITNTASNGKSVYGISTVGGQVALTGETVNIDLSSATARSTDPKASNQYSEMVGLYASTVSNVKNYENYIGSITSSENTAINITVTSKADQKTVANTNSHFGGGTPAIGIGAEGGSLDLKGTNTVTSTALAADAYGVLARNHRYDTSVGAATFNTSGIINNLKVTSSSQTGNAYGVALKTLDNTQKDVNLTLTGNVDINATSKSGVAYGAYLSGQSKATIGSNGAQVDLTTNGNTMSYAILVNKGAELTVQGKTVNLSSSGMGAYIDGSKSTLKLGTAETEAVNIESHSTGLQAIAGGQITVTGSNLNINANTDNDWLAGLWAQNNTADAQIPEGASKIVVNADNTTIRVKSGVTLDKNKSVGGIGIVGMSNGTVEVNGNLDVEAEDVILVRGYGKVLINESGNKTVKLTGNVDFNYDSVSSNTVVDATAKIKLTNSESFWTGRSLATADYAKGNIQAGEVDLPSVNENFQIGSQSEGLVLEVANGGTWNMTGNSFVSTLNMTGQGIVNGSTNVKKLTINNFNVSGAGNVFKLDKGTAFSNQITFADANSELITNLDTAFIIGEQDYLTPEGSTEKIVNNATAKLTVSATNGGTLTIDDAFTYSSDGLLALRNAYITEANSAFHLKLENAVLYVAPKAPDETGQSTMEIPKNTTVTLNANGDKDLSGGADNFSIKGNVNVVANETTSTVETQGTLNKVTVSGSADAEASLNLKSVEVTAEEITLKDAVLSVGDDVTTPEEEEKIETHKTTTLAVTKLVADNGAKVLVGNKDSIGLVEVDELHSKAGSIIFADPAWNKDTNLQTVSNASGLAATTVNGSIEGTVAAGENSFVAFGTDLANARNMINSVTTWSETATGAAIVVAQPISIGTNGSVIANPTWKTETDVEKSNTGKMIIAANGLLVVDQNAAQADGKPIIDGALTVEDGTVGVVNATEGTVNIANSVTGLTIDNLTFDNPFLDAELTNQGFTAAVNTSRLTPAVTAFGLQTMTRRVDSMMAASVADRTSIEQSPTEPVSLWVDVSGERYDTDGSNDLAGFKADMGYAIFGGDVGVTDTVRVGAAMEYATGSLRSSVNGAKNDLDAYGVTLYSTWQPCPYGSIVADLGYVKGSNDLTADTIQVTKSVDTTMISAGLRAQYKGSLGQFAVIPSIGVRVSRLETDDFRMSSTEIESQKQTLVQLPISLRINAGEAQADGWTVAPSFKIAWVPTFGDKEITLHGTDVDVIDTNPIQGTFGIRAIKQNLQIDADLMMGGGENGTSSIGAKFGVSYHF